MNLQFVFPAFLFALFAVAIPIIIHLFNFRRFKKVLFPNVRFLKMVKQETQSKSKLKHLLVLLARSLMVIFAVLAFAQPFIPAADTAAIKGRKAVSIYIDNSFSMESENADGKLLETAKRNAEEIASAFDAADRFQILTNDFEPHQQRMLSREDFLKAVDEVKTSPVSRTLSEIIKRQKDALSASGVEPANRASYILSDFQQSFADMANVSPDTTFAVHMIPVVTQPTNNVYIDSCWFTSPALQPGKTVELAVRLRNSGDENMSNVPLKLFINGSQKALTSADIAANAFADRFLSFTITETGWLEGQVTITDFPITFDDTYYFSAFVFPSIKVTAINGGEANNYLTTIFKNDPYFDFANVEATKVDYSTLSKNNLIIANEVAEISSGLSQELQKFIDGGGSVLLLPPGTGSVNSHSLFLSSLGAGIYAAADTQTTRVSNINLQSEVFRDVFDKVPDNMDLPVVNKRYPITRQTRSTEEVLLRVQNGESLMSRYSAGRGSICVSGVPLQRESSSLVRHAILVPLLYKIALLSAPHNRLAYTLGRDHAIELQALNVASDRVLHLVNKALAFDMIPEHRLTGSTSTLLLHNELREAGSYQLQMNNEIASVLAFNFDRNESDLTFFNADELNALTAQFGLTKMKLHGTSKASLASMVAQTNKGVSLWKWCIILALIFMGIEILLLKFWR